jgi:hypothetical protein
MQYYNMFVDFKYSGLTGFDYTPEATHVKIALANHGYYVNEKMAMVILEVYYD